MKACGLITEYNPLHNGHLYHIDRAKEISNATCMIAVMSGSFLQRGEPAMIDKFHRTKAALASGIDIVLELPFAYAVQSSNLFAKGAVDTLNEIGVTSLCFGSESGDISHFITSSHILKENQSDYLNSLKKHMALGLAYPKASRLAYEEIGLATKGIDLSQPNNILGFSYVNAILHNQMPIKPITIKRINNHYHDETITSPIASATSIRKQLITEQTPLEQLSHTIPPSTQTMLKKYKHKTSLWHYWELYFPFLHYKVMTMTTKELSLIHGVDEGLEYRIKQTAKKADSFQHWMELMKTKRYTWTRLQRMFVHILVNTKKSDIQLIHDHPSVPYIRLLGLTENGRAYLNQQKKQVTVPLITQLSRDSHPLLSLDERASDIYYSVLPSQLKRELRKQEIQPPIII